jgi:two-component system cell cycle sensor histidine kinase/response regulator CckA
MSMSSRTILVVDDEAPQRNLIRAILRLEAYTVLEAADYDEALAVQQRHLGEMDVVLTDLSLPGRNGHDLSKALLAREPHLKVIFLSGHAGAELLKFFDVPVTDMYFLEKPFQPADLLEHVKAVLEAPDPFAGSASAY